MSVKIMGLVWDCGLPRNEKYILLALADHADHEGYNIYPSVGRVAWKTGYDERMVQRIIKKLITHGVLVSDGSGKRGTNRYRIRLECLPKRPDYGEGQFARGGILPPQDVQNVTPGGGKLPPEPSSNHPLEPSFATSQNLDEFFGKKETPGLPPVKRLSNMNQSELDQAILLGQNGSTVLEEHHWHIHSPIREGVLAFITHSRLPVPRKKVDRTYWENEVQEHIFTYGLDRLPELYKLAVEEMRDRPLREKRHEAVMTIKSPRSVSGKIADLSTRQTSTVKAVRHADGGYYL